MTDLVARLRAVADDYDTLPHVRQVLREAADALEAAEARAAELIDRLYKSNADRADWQARAEEAERQLRETETLLQDRIRTLTAQNPDFAKHYYAPCGHPAHGSCCTKCGEWRVTERVGACSAARTLHDR